MPTGGTNTVASRFQRALQLLQRSVTDIILSHAVL
jgi:hypothetical protein